MLWSTHAINILLFHSGDRERQTSKVDPLTESVEMYLPGSHGACAAPAQPAQVVL